MDPDLETVWELFKHFYPEFSCNHMIVYKLLWRIEPKNAEFLIEESRLARATVYKILNDLMKVELIKRTSFKPVCYFALDPRIKYEEIATKIFSKIKKGKKKIKQLVETSSGLSGEFYLIQNDGGQMKLVNKQTRQTDLDDFAIKIKKAIDFQTKEEEKKKMKTWQVYG